MLFDDLFTDRKTNACAVIFRLIVKALKDDEDPVKKLGFDADPVIAHRKDVFTVSPLSGDSDVGRLVFPVKFDGVADKVLE